MKKTLIFLTMSVVGSVALADGYIGAVVAKGAMNYKCSDGLACKDRADIFKMYAGSRIDAVNQIDSGVGKVDSVEIGYLRAKKPQATGYQGISYSDPGSTGVVLPSPNDPNAVVVPVKYQISADMLTLAAVAHIPVEEDLVVGVKAGLAYVSATLKKEFNGASNNSMTASKFKPYVGLDVQYKVLDGLKVVGAVDLTQYDVNGTKGSIKSFGLGAEYAY